MIEKDKRRPRSFFAMEFTLADVIRIMGAVFIIYEAWSGLKGDVKEIKTTFADFKETVTSWDASQNERIQKLEDRINKKFDGD